MAKNFGDYLTVDDISSPFEAFGMTQDYKQGLVDKYNSALGLEQQGKVGTFGRVAGSSAKSSGGIRDVNAKTYDPGTFSYNQQLNLPSYQKGSSFNAPVFSSGSPFDAPDYIAPDINKEIGEMPSYSVGSYKAPTYTAPEYNERKVQALTQQQAAPAIRGLRSAIQRVQNTPSENQNINRMTMRDALAGYGQGLQSAMAGASATARNLYNEEYGRKADEAKTNFTAQADASKTSYLAQADAAKKNFEAQYDKYKMRWEDLSEQAKMNYTSKYNEALQNWQSNQEARKLNYQSKYNQALMNWEAEQEANKINFQNLTDAKKLAYTAGMDVAKTNFATQADWKKTQYGMENQKAMAEYDAALKKYLQETQIKSSEKTKAPGIVSAPSYSTEQWHTPMTPKTYDSGSYTNNFIQQTLYPQTMTNERAK